MPMLPSKLELLSNTFINSPWSTWGLDVCLYPPLFMSPLLAKKEAVGRCAPPFVKGDAGKTWVLAFSFSQRKSSPYQISILRLLNHSIYVMFDPKTQTCKSIWKSIFYSIFFQQNKKLQAYWKNQYKNRKSISINKVWFILIRINNRCPGWGKIAILLGQS